jgi:hypothetical protein
MHYGIYPDENGNFDLSVHPNRQRVIALTLIAVVIWSLGVGVAIWISDRKKQQ